MLIAAVRNLIERFSHHSAGAAVQSLASPLAEALAVATTARPEPRVVWPAPRLALVHQLWGPGFIFPGGEIETLRLVRPLGASEATSLLMLGIGSGGPASVAARNMGAWVTGLEHDPNLLAAARLLIKRAQLTKKITLKSWDPSNPVLPERSHHHCLALEPIGGARPEPILDTLSRALRPGGQLVMTELAAAAVLDPNDSTVRRWAQLERRDPAGVPIGVSMTRMLTRVGLDVRIAEDISGRHLEQAMLGWRVLLRDLRESKPSHEDAAHLVAEAELWLLRRRMIRDGKLRMMRWHALSRVPVV